MGDLFEGSERRGAHRARRSKAAILDGRGEPETVRTDGHRQRLGAWRGLVNTCGACRADHGSRGWWEAASDTDALHSDSAGGVMTVGGPWRPLAWGRWILGGAPGWWP
jgi:hypothetical protein